jgi:hypothetical protein
MPLFSGGNSEAIELALWICELNSITGFEVAAPYLR